MHKIDRLLKNADFIEYMNNNQKAELTRLYCRHDMTHALDVARIAYIIILEENLSIEKETVYAMGLLHDIGRWMEYNSGIDHASASKELARKLLQDSGFDLVDQEAILEAIGDHRDNGKGALLSALLFRADKLSRNCTSCSAIGTCKKFQNNEKPFLQY